MKNCMRPVRVCHGLSRSTLITNALYRRPPCSEPDHSGEVMTGCGRDRVSAKVMRLPDSPRDRSASSRPVRASSCSKPWVASRPLVVPDRVRMASHMRMSVSSRGRPRPAPERVSPLARSRTPISSSGLSSSPLTGIPAFSASGPREPNFSPISR